MKLNALQILRAFAAICVLVTHVFQYVDFKPFGNYYLSGQYGVDIFFILSGFLIYLTIKENTNGYTYARKRIFRIYPLYIFSVFLYAIFNVGKYPFDFTINSFFRNISMFPWDKSLSYDSLIVGVAWSTVYEMFFYSLFFFIIISKISKKSIFIIIPSIFIICNILYRYIFGLNDEIPVVSLLLSLGKSTHLFLFLAGCLISELFISKKIPVIDKKAYTILFAIVLLVTIIMLFTIRNTIVSLFVCSSLFILISQFEKYYELKLNNLFVKMFVHWGDISFSIYIYHIFFIQIFIVYFNVDNVVILLLLTLILTILFSNLTYKYIEKPFIEYAKSRK